MNRLPGVIPAAGKDQDMKVNDFFKDYRKMVKMLPESEKVVDQYERGMITLSDAVNGIADQYINYLYNDDPEGSEL